MNKWKRCEIGYSDDGVIITLEHKETKERIESRISPDDLVTLLKIEKNRDLEELKEILFGSLHKSSEFFLTNEHSRWHSEEGYASEHGQRWKIELSPKCNICGETAIKSKDSYHVCGKSLCKIKICDRFMVDIYFREGDIDVC